MNSNAIPRDIQAFFAQRQWQIRSHQAAMVDAWKNAFDALLIAPTGGGKTLAGFLPSLVAACLRASTGPKKDPCLRTLYISPLKALTTDVARNLHEPIAQIGLDIRAEVRTGDTPANRRKRQREKPPDILLTTPESLALLISYEDASAYFAGLEEVVIDELHALADNKRGALLSLSLAWLRSLAPQARFSGLSATVAEPDILLQYLAPDPKKALLIRGQEAVDPAISMILPDAYMPWAGHIALYAIPEIMELIAASGTTLVFVNTRAQAELVFGALWKANENALPIALHHGSLAVEQRRRVEAAMAKGALRAVVCTSSLDLGIDWGAVDLVVQVGAPKGSSRLLQRVGRANHRMDEPSRAVLIPANRFEVLECLAAKDAVRDRTLDGGELCLGGLDVLAQHILCVACSGPFFADELYASVCKAAPYRDLPRSEFDAVLNFVATGGYALQKYPRYQRLRQNDDGAYVLMDPRARRGFRMNVGTIVEQPTLKVKFKRGRSLGEIEEYFISMLSPDDTFLFAGRLLAFVGIEGNDAIVKTAGKAGDPKVPAYAGGRLPLTSHLADRVRTLLADRDHWPLLPEQVQEWLGHQGRRSGFADPDSLLVETFERRGRFFLVAYCFAGRNAHQTLGMLLTRRLQRAGAHPLGFVASDYCIATWSLRPVDDIDALFDVDMLGDDLETWLDESSMIKRTFRNCAVVAGLIERRRPGEEKTGRQVTFNADMIYEVLRKYEPDHVLLKAARAEAAAGLTDVRRLADLLVSIQGRITHHDLPRISPFAVSIIAGIGREFVEGDSVDAVLDEITADLVAEALMDEDGANHVQGSSMVETDR